MGEDMKLEGLANHREGQATHHGGFAPIEASSLASRRCRNPVTLRLLEKTSGWLWGGRESGRVGVIEYGVEPERGRS